MKSGAGPVISFFVQQQSYASSLTMFAFPLCASLKAVLVFLHFLLSKLYESSLYFLCHSAKAKCPSTMSSVWYGSTIMPFAQLILKRASKSDAVILMWTVWFFFFGGGDWTINFAHMYAKPGSLFLFTIHIVFRIVNISRLLQSDVAPGPETVQKKGVSWHCSFHIEFYLLYSVCSKASIFESYCSPLSQYDWKWCSLSQDGTSGTGKQEMPEKGLTMVI